MEKQKAQLIALYENLGYDTAKATAMAVSFLTPEDGKEPELPTNEILLQAQKYARPLLQPVIEQELRPAYKAKYHGEAISKMVAASNGKIRKADYDDNNVEKAAADLAAALAAGGGATDSEKDQTINDLRQQLIQANQEKEQIADSIRGEYSEKENGRMVYDTLLSKLSAIQNPGEGKVGKKLTVDQAHAAKAILRELGDDYILKFDEQSKDIAIFDKKNPDQRVALPDNSRFVNANELIEQSLSRNKWVAESNGGTVNKNFGNLVVSGKTPNDNDVKYPDQLTKGLADNIQKHLPAA